FGVTTNGDPEQDQGGESSGLHDRERRLNDLPFLDPAQIDPGQNPDADQGDESLRRQPQLHGRAGGREIHLREPRVAIGSNGRPQYSEESAKGYGDGGDGPSLDHHEQSPAIKKAHEMTHGLTKENVLATCSRIQR